jgi:hypothetical protein
VVAGLHEAKRNTFVIAPQRQQVLGLEMDGLRQAETVSSFLLRKSLPSRSVVLVDEAAQIGVRQMSNFSSSSEPMRDVSSLPST